jgi:Spy/CpxP family protein refolding chaperone
MKGALLIPMLALTAIAQPPPHEFFAWWDSPIVKDLKVTDDQQKQIKTIVQEYRNKLIDLRASVEKADGNLNDILNEDKIDMKRATDAVDKMAAAKGEMNRNMTLMSVSLRAVLTPVQWHELQKRQPHPQQMNGMMPGHGRMMGMPGPGMQGRGPMMGPQNRQGNPQQPQGQQQPPKPVPPKD